MKARYSLAALAAAATMGIFSPAVQALNFSRLTTGPEAPAFSDTVRDGSTTYALAGHLIFKSTNGTSWTLATGQPPAAANNIAAAGGRLYALAANKVFASSNDGAQWSDITGPLANFQEMYTAGGSVFVITAKSEGQNFVYRLFRGDGQTNTWTDIFNSTDFVGGVVQAGNNLCLTNGNSGIKFSTNGGTSWSTASGANGNLGVIGVSPDGTTVLVSSATNALSVRRSVNSCANFGTLPQGTAPNGSTLRALGVDSAGAYYAGFEDGSILKSTNTGTSFAADNSGDLPPAKSFVGVYSFTPVGSAMLARTSGGLFNNGGGTWAAASSGISTSFNSGMVSRAASADAIGVASAGYWVSDTPASAAFAQRNNGLEVRDVAALLRSGNVLLAGTRGLVNFSTSPATGENGLFRSTDDGLNWTRILPASGLPEGATVEGFADDGTTVYAIVSNAANFQSRGLYKSIDAGLNWTAVAAMANQSIRNLAGRNGAVYAYIGNIGVFKSADGGTTFPAINNGLATSNRFGKVFTYSGGLIASANGIVHRSIDDGANWSATTGFAVSKFGIELLSMAEDAAGVLYLGDEHAGLSVSNDAGATWTPDSDGLTEAEVCIPRIQNLLVKNGKVYLGSGGTGIHVSNVLGSGTPGDSVACTTNVDVFPQNFSFTAQNNVTPSTVIQSNTVTISGLGSGVTVPVSVTGGEYSIGCDGNFVSTAGSIGNQTVCVRHTSAATGETQTVTTLTVGDVSSSFTSATGLVFTGRDDQINTSFGSNGFATASGVTQAEDIEILADGRIVAGGGISGFDNGFSMTMYTAAGALDTTFGTGGKVTIQITSGSDLLSAVIPLPGGKFMLVGTVIGSNNLVALVRINANGTVDTGFGTNGIVTFDVRPAATNNFELVGDATLLNDGNILVVGAISTSGAGTQYIAIKFSQDGVADTNFGADDALFADGVANSGSLGTSSISAGAVAVQSTGKFVIAGLRQPSFSTLDAVAVRFNANGTLDTTWGTSGVRVIPGANDIKDAVVIAGDKIVLAGSSNRPLVARLNADGTLDTSFAGDGVFTLDTITGRMTALEVMPDGDVAAIGMSTAPDNTQQLLYIRLTSAGVLDNTFGPNGQGFLFRGPVNGTQVTGISTALRADGGLMVGGSFGTPQALFVFGGGSGPVADTTPEPFSFAAQNDVEPMATVTSVSATISGIDAPASVTVSNGSYSIGCGTTFVSTAGTISNGQSICVQHTAAMPFSTGTTTTLTIGGVAGTFTSTTRAGNSTPNDFQFMDATNVALSSTVISNAIVISGNEVPAPVSVQNGEYSVNCTQNFTSSSGSITAGQTVCVRHTAAATASTAVSTTLSIGGKSDVFTSTTAAAQVDDTTPNSFSFTDQNDVATSTLLVSNPFTVNGIDAPAPISIVNGEYSLDNAAFTAVSGSVVQGTTVRVRHTSAATPATVTNTTLTVGGVSDTFTSTTASQTPNDTTPNAFSFADRSGVVPNSAITSNTITVSGINAAAAISISGGEYRIGSGGFTAQAGTVVGGDTVAVRLTAAAAGQTANAILTIGGVSDTFSATSASQSGGGTVNDPSGRPVALATTVGSISSFQLIAQPAGAPTIGVSYPNGFYSYNVTGLPNGGTAQVTFTLPNTGANGYVKCTNGVCIRIPDASLTINGQTLTLAMVDGGPFDEDGIANGTIVDPGAPAIFVSDINVSSGGGGAFGWASLLLALPALLRRRKLAAGLFAVLAALPAAAADSKFYVGLRGGSATAHLDSARLTAELRARGHNVSATVDESSIGGTFYLGYRLEPEAALELGLMHAGQYATRISGTPTNAQRLADDAAHLLGGSGNAISATLRYDFPLAGRLDFSPRFGLYGWKTEVSITSGGVSTDGSETGLGGLVGLGLSLRLAPGWRAGLGYELLRSTTQNTIEQWQGQLEYRWGS